MVKSEDVPLWWKEVRVVSKVNKYNCNPFVHDLTTLHNWIQRQSLKDNKKDGWQIFVLTKTKTMAMTKTKTKTKTRIQDHGFALGHVSTEMDKDDE